MEEDYFDFFPPFLPGFFLPPFFLAAMFTSPPSRYEVDRDGHRPPV
ncbi:MAG: hypothetical protein JOZ24_01290 [Candidatus Eremiobacteraeota bacterium]|nr:hypothetical protein [Candidatus Eremiobacteraeota bacterium]